MSQHIHEDSDLDERRVTVVIPAYNEEETIRAVVEGAKRYARSVIVVDDGSEDGTTSEALRGGAVLVTHPTRLGVGSAIQTGMLVALQRDAPLIVTLDADGQHRVDEIPRVIEPLVKGEADVTIGSRLAAGGTGMPLPRRVVNSSLSKLTSCRAGRTFTDSQSGFRGYTPEAARRLLEGFSRAYSWASGTSIDSVKMGLTVVELPITAVYIPGRRRGAGLTDALRIIFSILSRRRKA